MNPKPKSQPKPFESKHIFLTYAQVEGKTKEDILSHVKGVIRWEQRELLKYIVAQEFHQDGGIHFHVYLDIDKPIQKRDALIFDIREQGKPNIHPNVQKCRQPLQVRRYCIKDEDYITNCSPEEFKEKQTSRDVQRIIGERVIAGESLCTIIREYPEQIINYHRLVQSTTLFKLHSHKPVQTDRTRGVWIWGLAGVGKSHFVREYCLRNNLSLYIKPQSQWFDGYQGEHAILLDDLDQCKDDFGHFIKIWSDKYAVTAEVKCGTVPLMHVLFFVTSNHSISNLYADIREKQDGPIRQDRNALRAAVSRRFQEFQMTDQNDQFNIVHPKPSISVYEVQEPEEVEEMDL